MNAHKQSCSKCKKQADILITNANRLDWLCDRCYYVETGEKVLEEPEHWQIGMEEVVNEVKRKE